ncbi:unnamed protein product [Medioppia subpectinata]|uniref:Cytochrome P450 n=1 Tax=Medioppia subpectinata TaxID=1979941 RepID=A0A7R9PVF2_9ACAR|nr:unnamed protein product [Medioppia subpectinata]CAG2101756.1 unnamed protein product [Medioppia subpectinata]
MQLLAIIPMYLQYLFYLVAAIFITFQYLKYNRLHNYWKDRNISGPKAIPYFGNSLSLFLTPKPYIERQWYNSYGRLYGHYELGKRTLTVADPELIKQILVKEFDKFRNRLSKESRKIAPNMPKHLFNSNDDEWKRLRLIVSPAFTSGKLKRLYPL